MRRSDFLVKAQGAILRGGPAPDSLMDFAMEVQFWERLGLRAEDLDRMPWRKVQEYSTYIELLLQKEQLERRKNGG